jgi:16S rRNA (guanine527-N7)-methyltransferase
MSTVPDEAARLCERHGVPIEGEVGARLTRYLEALLETNAAFNLTAVTNHDEAWLRHIADSLSLVPWLRELATATRIVDVGSGGGLPGLPLAIALPDRTFTLLEATGKKARFLEQTAQQLGLANVRVVSERAETFGQGDGRERFDAATSRAVSRMPVLVELSLPLLRVGGSSLSIKGEQAELEVQEAARALTLLQGVVRAVERTPTGTLVRIDKTGSTPARFPRKPGEPKRAPL